MNERRKLERFDLRVPAKIEVVGQDYGTKTLNLFTKNICAGGAFFNSAKSLPQNTKVAVELVLDFRGLKNHVSRWTKINVSGSVLRSEPTGMTISFDKEFNIQPLNEA
jgi:hypothetical protein